MKPQIDPRVELPVKHSPEPVPNLYDPRQRGGVALKELITANA